MWRETGKYTIELHEFLLQKEYGKKRLSCVYVIRDIVDAVVLYVGQSTAGVQSRIWQHIHTNKLLADAICRRWEPPDPLHCEVAVIHGSLDEAERWYIQTLSPAFNKIKYKNKAIVPPEQVVSTQPIYSELSKWKNAAVSLPHIQPIGTPRIMYDTHLSQDTATLERLDQLYAKAYRDPGHPDAKNE